MWPVSNDSSAPFPPRADPAEVAHFDALARRWWDPDGPMKPLHRLNPVRLAFIRDVVCEHFGRDAREAAPFAGLTALDVGCGAGMLCEPLRRMGAAVTGLDPAPENIAVARAHAEAGGLEITYRGELVEDVAAAGERFDIVTAMEVIEHVPDPAGFVAACCAAVKPDGVLLMATLNRTRKAWALAIVGAEYVLRWVPRGTHDWNRFVTPEELAAFIAGGGMTVQRTEGVVYEPWRDVWRRSRDTDVNYMLSARRLGGQGVF